MNNFKYNIENKVFDEKLKAEIVNISNKFKNGEIKTKAEYNYEIKNAVLKFYETFDKPSFEIEEFINIPYKSTLINMIKTGKDDMGTILKGASELSEVLYSSQKVTNDNILFLSKKVSGVLSQVDELETKIDNLKKDSTIAFGDDFKTKSNTFIVKNTEKEDEALCDLGAQALTLPVLKNSSITSRIYFEILDSSNGYPGNTHQVYSSNSDDIKFKGEENPHLDLNNIRYTSDASSAYIDTDYFEFELFSISDEVKMKTGNIGFRYKEGFSWVTEEDSLKLHLKITLDTKTKLNHIVLSSLPKIYDVEVPILKRMIISDDYSKMQTLELNKKFEEKTIINFDTQDVKFIIIEIEQAEAYKTLVCRQYALNIDPLKIPKFLDNENENYIKFEKPTQSIEFLGLKYNKDDKSIIYPSTYDAEKFSNKEYAKSKLFLLNQEDLEYNIKKDVVEAYRYSISIAEADVRYREFKNLGIYVSENFYVGEEIKKIVLEADDFIPHAFGEEDHLRYYISFDDGSEWIRINPRHRAHLGSCCIYINHNGAIVNRNKNAIYYDSLLEVKFFRVKIELSRPNDIKDKTPIVESYKVLVGVEDEE